jgi:hypothetical protein
MHFLPGLAELAADGGWHRAWLHLVDEVVILLAAATRASAMAAFAKSWRRE